MHRIEEIDYLRGLAIALTLVAHAGVMTSGYWEQRQHPEVYLWFVQNVGQFWGGVEIFFVISGFVISRQLWPALDYARANGRVRGVLREFYIRRAFRILPLAVVTASATMLASLYFNKSGAFGDAMANVGNYLAALFFFENLYLKFNLSRQFSVYWSLSIEEQFYLLFPILCLLTPARFRWNVILTLILVQFFIPRPPNQQSWISMIRYDALLMGVAIFLWTRTRHFADFPRVVWLLRAAFLLQLAAVILIPVQLRGVFFSTGLLDLSAACIVAIAALEAGVYQLHGMAGRAALWLGTRSYAIYLLHIPVIMLLRELAVRYEIGLLPAHLLDWRVALVLAAIFLASEVAHRSIEAPLRRQGVLVANRRTGVRTPVSAV
jgi:peptidoglycan/LPS O-acetylase OafA/YrhL